MSDDTKDLPYTTPELHLCAPPNGDMHTILTDEVRTQVEAFMQRTDIPDLWKKSLCEPILRALRGLESSSWYP